MFKVFITVDPRLSGTAITGLQVKHLMPANSDKLFPIVFNKAFLSIDISTDLATRLNHVFYNKDKAYIIFNIDVVLLLPKEAYTITIDADQACGLFEFNKNYWTEDIIESHLKFKECDLSFLDRLKRIVKNLCKI